MINQHYVNMPRYSKLCFHKIDAHLPLFSLLQLLSFSFIPLLPVSVSDLNHCLSFGAVVFEQFLSVLQSCSLFIII